MCNIKNFFVYLFYQYILIVNYFVSNLFLILERGEPCCFGQYGFYSDMF